MNDSQKLTQWMKRNSTTLRRYAPNEIAWLARQNGFSLELACRNISDHVTRLKRLYTFWASPLADKWMNVVSYERGHDVA